MGASGISPAGGLDSGICAIAPQWGHFPFLPAAESGVRTS
jgi:hypothetical protein